MASKKRSKAALRRAALKGWKTRRKNLREALAYERAERAAIEGETPTKLRRRWDKYVPIDGYDYAKDTSYRFRPGSRTNRYAIANPDYMTELSDQFDIDISDLYDMYYGYYED